jgi:hypothetical protein
MNSYWKSVAAEVLPSWLKNLRAGQRADVQRAADPAAAHPPLAAAPDTEPRAGEAGIASPGARSEAPAPGTTAPKAR